MANPFSNIAQIMGNAGMQQAAPAATDPRQQTMMQQLGVTNPLLQQFGKQLGNAAGIDMRSPAQQMNKLLQGADTSTPEGRQAVLAAVSKVDPMKALELDMQFKKQAQTDEANKLNMALKRQELANAKKKGETENVYVQVKAYDNLGNPTVKSIIVTRNVKTGKLVDVDPEIAAMLNDGDIMNLQSTGEGHIEYFLDENNKPVKALIQGSSVYRLGEDGEKSEISLAELNRYTPMERNDNESEAAPAPQAQQTGRGRNQGTYDIPTPPVIPSPPSSEVGRGRNKDLI
jgi:hypothetical protein